jgi:hypothetical protein
LLLTAQGDQRKREQKATEKTEGQPSVDSCSLSAKESQGRSNADSRTLPGDPHMSSEFADCMGSIDQEERRTSKTSGIDGERGMAQSASVA